MKAVVETLIVPVLKKVGIKVASRKLKQLIPVVGAVVGGRENFAIVNDTGHKFLELLEKFHTLLQKKQQKRGCW